MAYIFPDAHLLGLAPSKLGPQDFRIFTNPVTRLREVETRGCSTLTESRKKFAAEINAAVKEVIAVERGLLKAIPDAWTPGDAGYFMNWFELNDQYQIWRSDLLRRRAWLRGNPDLLEVNPVLRLAQVCEWAPSELAEWIGATQKEMADAITGKLDELPLSWSLGLACEGDRYDDLNLDYLEWKRLHIVAKRGQGGRSNRG